MHQYSSAICILDYLYSITRAQLAETFKLNQPPCSSLTQTSGMRSKHVTKVPGNHRHHDNLKVLKRPIPVPNVGPWQRTWTFSPKLPRFVDRAPLLCTSVMCVLTTPDNVFTMSVITVSLSGCGYMAKFNLRVLPSSKPRALLLVS